MKVLKFGGTSVGSVQNMNNVKQIIKDGERKIVVLSAMSGTTNGLLEIVEAIKNKQSDKSYYLIDQMHDKYKQVVQELIEDEELRQATHQYVSGVFNELHNLESQPDLPSLERQIVAKGELLSTHIFQNFLKQDTKSTLLNALDFMRKDENDDPDNFYIQQNLLRLINDNPDIDIFITQGFITLNKKGEIDNLKRGGSDYTASIIGAAVNADDIQIWTDIDGFHNNDPRVVDKTKSIQRLSFDEAAELAYFGAKILHPMTILPAKEKNIPVWLKNTMEPSAYGTLISNEYEEDGIKAIAAKDNITVIKIKSARMFLAYGFLKKVFEIFEKYQTSIDMITTSEVAISLTIDDTSRLEEITNDLSRFSDITVENNQTIITIVGHHLIYDQAAKDIFQVLKDFKIRMISYGGSPNNISFVVDANDKKSIMQALNQYLFSLK